MSYTTISNAGNGYDAWLKALSFYKDELLVATRRLEEVAGKNTEPALGTSIEHFQNQFVIQRTNIDTLSHNIKEFAHFLASDAQQHIGYVDSRFGDLRKKLEEEYTTLEKIINELRHEFNVFAAQWM